MGNLSRNTDNLWQHVEFNHQRSKKSTIRSVVFTKNGFTSSVIDEEQQSIYINGKLVSSVAHTGDLQIRTAFRIGRHKQHAAPGRRRMISRTAAGLNAHEVEALYKDSDMIDLEADLLGIILLAETPEITVEMKIILKHLRNDA